MRISRIYIDVNLEDALNKTLKILRADTQYNYICNVLRLKPNHELILFNNTSWDYSAVITNITAKFLEVKITAKTFIDNESQNKLTIALAISKPQHFEISVQKAVELGVDGIIPILTKRSNQKTDRAQKIIIAAAEQCGRSTLPILSPALDYQDFLNEYAKKEYSLIILDPYSKTNINDYKINLTKDTIVLIGAEGGFTTKEINEAIKCGFSQVSLGSRILRTETAAIAIIVILQFLLKNL